MNEYEELVLELPKTYYNLNYDNLVSQLSDEVEEPTEFLDGILFSLKIIKQQDEVKLYQVVFTDDISKIKNNKLGHLFTQDVNEFDDETILNKFGMTNQKNITNNDYFIVTIIMSPHNIDFTQTLLKNVSNPWDSEIIIKDSYLAIIVDIE